MTLDRSIIGGGREKKERYQQISARRDLGLLNEADEKPFDSKEFSIQTTVSFLNTDDDRWNSQTGHLLANREYCSFLGPQAKQTSPELRTGPKDSTHVQEQRTFER